MGTESMTAPDRCGEVTEQLGRMEDQINRYSELYSNLTDTLAAVTRQPADPLGEEADQESLVPIATRIRILRDRLEGINDSLSDLTDRIEV